MVVGVGGVLVVGVVLGVGGVSVVGCGVGCWWGQWRSEGGSCPRAPPEGGRQNPAKEFLKFIY